VAVAQADMASATDVAAALGAAHSSTLASLLACVNASLEMSMCGPPVSPQHQRLLLYWLFCSNS
jgi:hypothetical protein